MEIIISKKPPPNNTDAASSKIDMFNHNPKIMQRVPVSKNIYDILETKSTFAILTPAKTGNIWVSAPNITKLKKPIVIACVITIASIECLLVRAAASLKRINIPAKIAKRGAVRKNLRGADMGGA
ncbi:hypothetical protein [Sulfurimonas sp.]|uniref:hypothetical protein n=1 Tax=Sulfurimonas sp. TaxID=2022749 RepID=UPI0025DBC167|nr:hypothetical protein [Sulfurimonas sp.]